MLRCARDTQIHTAALFLLAALRHAGAVRVDASGTHGARIRRKNLVVPQGGFEPSTYRLRSDCSAVELLRRPERAFYQTSIKQAAPS
jgi:hypothetical protein